jgi:hypothetical protein
MKVSNMEAVLVQRECHTGSTGEHITLLKGFFEVLHTDTLFIHNIFRWSTRE